MVNENWQNGFGEEGPLALCLNKLKFPMPKMRFIKFDSNPPCGS